MLSNFSDKDNNEMYCLLLHANKTKTSQELKESFPSLVVYFLKIPADKILSNFKTFNHIESHSKIAHYSNMAYYAKITKLSSIEKNK